MTVDVEDGISEHPDQVMALRPFVPARDFARSRAFYAALGFRETFANGEIAIMKLGAFSFILQDFHVAELADNLMLQLMVRDVDAWWRRTDVVRAVEGFDVKPPRPPAMQPWGMKVGFVFDPSGVLWHVAEAVF